MVVSFCSVGQCNSSCLHNKVIMRIKCFSETFDAKIVFSLPIPVVQVAYFVLVSILGLEAEEPNYTRVYPKVSGLSG